MSQMHMAWDAGPDEMDWSINADRWTMDDIQRVAGCLPRIGEATAERVVNGLGLGFFDAVERSPLLLTEVSSLNLTQANEAWEGWQFLVGVYRWPIVPRYAAGTGHSYQTYHNNQREFLRQTAVDEAFALVARWLNDATPPPCRADCHPHLTRVKLPDGSPTLVRSTALCFQCPYVEWSHVTIHCGAGDYSMTLRNPDIVRPGNQAPYSVIWSVKGHVPRATERIQSRRIREGRSTGVTG